MDDDNCANGGVWLVTNVRVRATIESSSNRESFDRISSCQEFWNFVEI